MSAIPNDDKRGFVAEEPEHCFACYRLIRPGQTYYLTIEVSWPNILIRLPSAQSPK